MPDNKPRGRQRNVTGSGSGAYKKGSGLGSGPVGNSGTHSGGSHPASHPGGSGPNYSNNRPPSSGPSRAVKRGGGGIGIIVVILILYFMFRGGGSDDSSYYDDSAYTEPQQTQNTTNLDDLMGGSSSGSSSASSLISSLVSGSYGDMGIYTDSVYTTEPEMVAPTASAASSGPSLDTSVSSGARDKRTVIKGDGSDMVTVMVYLCGTDLESKNGMASNDLAEMAKGRLSDNMNIIVYTGGCRAWKTQGISNKANQIYLISNGGMKRLVDDDGSKPMTDPATLSAFIRYCAKNFPANRNELIFWDHGGGSVSGYGYDEKMRDGDTMDLSEIDKALNDGGVDFDFIGFDACLMATAENAIMLNRHADYMIASEETEPGIGWYYTNWVTKLAQDPSMPTIEVGRNIIDDFTYACSSQARGQKTTLSIVDLAEFSDTVPDKLAAFSTSVSDMISHDEYRKVADARQSSKEFGQQSGIDQVDLIDLAMRINTTEGRELADAVRASVKYSRSSSNINHANGLAMYFPCHQRRLVRQATSTFDKIGMDKSYITCINDAASMQTAGNVAAGSGYDLFSSLAGTSSSGYSYGGGSSDMIGALLGSFLSARSVPGDAALDQSNTGYYDEKSFSDDYAAEYIALNMFDASALRWKDAPGGEKRISIAHDQWDLIEGVDLNMFLDDGSGYIDLGLDNVYEYDGDDMIADMSGAWLGLNGQIMPYYHLDTEEDGDSYTITGYAPILLNGVRSKLLIVFDDENPNGYVAGAVTDYDHADSDPSQAVAKSTIGLNVGDKIQFVCDYYTYDLKYDDSYLFGEEITVTEDLTVSDLTIDDATLLIAYRFTDIYDHEYWTPMVFVD